MRSRVFRAACVAAAGSCLALTPVTAVAGQAEPAAQQPGVPAAPLPPAFPTFPLGLFPVFVRIIALFWAVFLAATSFWSSNGFVFIYF